MEYLKLFSVGSIWVFMFAYCMRNGWAGFKEYMKPKAMWAYRKAAARLSLPLLKTDKEAQQIAAVRKWIYDDLQATMLRDGLSKCTYGGKTIKRTGPLIIRATRVSWVELPNADRHYDIANVSIRS